MKFSVGRKWIFIVVSVPLLVNCDTERVVPIPETFPVEKALTGEVFEMEGVVDPVQCTVADNHLFLTGMMSVPIFQQYKLPEVAYVKSFGTRGRGPGEYLSPRMSASTDSKTLYVNNSAGFDVFRITENGELLRQPDIKSPRNAIYNQFHIVNDSMLIYNLGAEDVGIGKIDLQTWKSNTIQLDKDYDGEYFVNPERGTIAVNDEYIVYAYLYRKQIDIYNLSDMSLKVRLRAKGHQYVTPIPIERNSPHYYSSVCVTERFIYAFCVNPNTDDENNKRYVEVFDYEGNPMKRYNMGRYFGVPWVVSSDGRTIYSYHSQFDDGILKFNLE